MSLLQRGAAFARLIVPVLIAFVHVLTYAMLWFH